MTQKNNFNNMFYRLLSTVKRCFMLIIKKILLIVIPQGKVILFESHPDFSDNTYPVYKLLKKFLPNYKMVWILNRSSSESSAINDADDTIQADNKNIREKIKYYYYRLRCSAIVQCNVIHRKLRSRQLSVFLAHGSETKRVKELYNINNSLVDYLNLQSHYFDESSIDNLNCSPEKFVYLGYPRCDYFYSNDNPQNIEQIITGEKFKFIIWLPTFRQHRTMTRDDAPDSMFSNIGVPLFYSPESLINFNEFIRNLDIHILYKPHPAQYMGVIKAIKSEDLSNFHIIYDSDILGKGLQLYQVIAQSQALITDYSSVFWDYLLLDRPIAITTDDLQNWKMGRGFALDLEKIHEEATEKISCDEELRNFVINLLKGNDPKKERRREIRDLSNMHQDGNSALRVANFVLEKLGIPFPKN